MYCVFPKQAEKSQLELLLPAVIFIFFSDCALQSNPATIPGECPHFGAGCWAGRSAVGVVGWCEGGGGVGGWGGRAQDWPGYSPWADFPVPWEKCLQWVFYSMFSLLSLVQQNNYQGPGCNNVFKPETSL